MGFGIEITGADGGGDFIVQDTDLNMINYQITASGQAATVSTSSVSEARLFVNGKNVSGTAGNFVTLIKSGAIIIFTK